MVGTNGSNGSSLKIGTDTVKTGLAQMLKGGVIVSKSVTNRFFMRLQGCMNEKLKN